MFKMSFFKNNWILCIILFFAFFIRFYHITYPITDVFAFRQTQTASVIRNFYREGINLFYPKVDSLGQPGYLVLEFPLYQAIVALLYHLFSPDILYARITSIFFGFLSAILLYKITLELLNKKLRFFQPFSFYFLH